MILLFRQILAGPLLNAIIGRLTSGVFVQNTSVWHINLGISLLGKLESYYVGFYKRILGLNQYLSVTGTEMDKVIDKSQERYSSVCL